MSLSAVRSFWISWYFLLQFWLKQVLALLFVFWLASIQSLQNVWPHGWSRIGDINKFLQI